MTHPEPTIIPQEWTFHDKNVAETFDHHVREQLPWYDIATTAVAFLARHYLQPNTRAYDLGCSNGNIGRAINETLQQRNVTLIAIDDSPEMLTHYNAPGKPNLARIQDYDYQPHSLTIAFLALQFLPFPAKLTTLQRTYNTLLPGGAILLVDRFIPEAHDPDADQALTRLTLDAKLRAGATPDDIISKELSLVGIQRPLTTSLYANLPQSRVTTFFRFGHFQGHVITRAE